MRPVAFPLRSMATTVLLLALGLVIASCSSGSTADGTSGQETTTTVAPTNETEPPTESPSATEAVGNAVDALAAIGTYTFEARILVAVSEVPTEIEVEGWVAGSDRELVMRLQGREVTTRVVSGVATVDRDGETVEVPLSEAGSAPSIFILKSIRDAEFVNDTTVTGILEAADVASSDYEVVGSALITVELTAGGDLAGYAMTAEDQSWTVDVKFEDIGEDPRA